jgi:hypothetical protein
VRRRKKRKGGGQRAARWREKEAIGWAVQTSWAGPSGKEKEKKKNGRARLQRGKERKGERERERERVGQLGWAQKKKREGNKMRKTFECF